MSIHLTDAQRKEILAELSAGKTLEKILQLEDFSTTLESVILDRLAALDEPVLTDPRPSASSRSTETRGSLLPT